MSKLLIQNSTILAANPVEQKNSFTTPFAIFPKDVIEGWQLVEVELPNNFSPDIYEWNGDSLSVKPVKQIVPEWVTMRQARLALLQVGKLNLVDAAIDSLPSPQKEAAKIEWDYSSVVERNRPLVQALGPLLGLSEDELDTLFVEAAKL